VSPEEENILKLIGNTIRKLRTKNNISQAQLAFEVKTDGRHIRRIEKGEVNLSFITLYRISQVFDCSIDDLINH
jgi:transcriptional regulator with XRE-family HTH domain